jgi:hypothetical protein
MREIYLNYCKDILGTELVEVLMKDSPSSASGYMKPIRQIMTVIDKIDISSYAFKELTEKVCSYLRDDDYIIVVENFNNGIFRKLSEHIRNNYNKVTFTDRF